ncbi:hypothetical protein R1sor_008303 [Riccia sorocarpa]|uniref:Integrator complex subunit 7 n=1 Tax=Riccia sorocarpa TaxID=122646 RepID=A0ABD3HSZ9_9MARC
MADQHTGPQMMEIAAAKALQWNVDFDRGLRSVKPGNSGTSAATNASFGVRCAGAQCEAVMKLGPQLVRWSQNCMVTASSANLFKLEAGQDRVFANAILLRLAETFRTGNNFIRLCILKVLMLEYKERGRMGETFPADNCDRMVKRRLTPTNSGSRSRAIRMSRSEEGLLTKKRIANHVEMLRRVKSVLDSGDPTSRALALRVLGCLADLGKDSVDVHNLVLQAVQSPHHQEVSAAFFAMGCLSVVSQKFAEQALEKAFEMINRMGTPPQMKVLAIRFFSKVGHSPVLSLQAHEMGRRVMLRQPVSEIITTMLTALSILAAESVVVIKSQVEMLMNYLAVDPRMTVRAVALKSLGNLVSQAVHSTSFTKDMFRGLFKVLQDVALPSSLHVLGLQVIRKLFRHCGASLDSESLEQVMLWTEFSAMKGGDWPVISEALSLLVEVAGNLTRLGDTVKNRIQAAGNIVLQDLSTRLCLLICDQVSVTCLHAEASSTPVNLGSMPPSLPSDEESSSMPSAPKEKTTFLSVLLVKLMEGNPRVGWILVDNISVLMESLAEKSYQRRKLTWEKPQSMVIDSDNKENSTADAVSRGTAGTARVDDVLQAMLMDLGRCLAICVSFQECQEKGVGEVDNRLRRLTEALADARVSPSVFLPVIEAKMKSTVLLESLSYGGDISAEKGPQIDRTGERRRRGVEERKPLLGKESRSFLNKSVSNFIQEGNGWVAYKVGEKAASCGLWKLAETCFSCLVEKTSSEGCYFWLKALSELCTAESLLQDGETRKDLEGSRSSDMDVDQREKGVSGEESDTADKDGEQESASLDDFRLERFAEAAASALNLFPSSISNLSAAVCSERTFDFQRWVLNLRLEMVNCIAELLGLVESISSFDNDAGVIDLEDEGKDNSLKNLVSALRACTEKVELLGSRLRKLSEEYDLVTISFMGIDSKTVGILSKAALLCSLLAFCSLGVFSPQQTSFHPVPNFSVTFEASALDLYYRLQQIESGGWDDLLCFAVQCGSGAFTGRALIGSFIAERQDTALLKLCRWAVDSILDVQKQHSLLGVVRGTRLLGQIIEEVLHLPWISPPYFFCTRPRAGVELFVAQAGNIGESEDLSVAQGGTLSLSVCLQIANAPVEAYFYPKRVVCAFTYQPVESTWEWDDGSIQSAGAGLPGSHSSQLDMVEKLIAHSRSRNVVNFIDPAADELQRDEQKQMGGRGDCFFTVTVDAKGQGFASCTVDVRDAPPGEYDIFLSCLCFDKGNRKWILPLLNTRPRFRIT